MELAVIELVTTAVEHAHGEQVTVVVALTADPPTVAISVRSVRTPTRITDSSTCAEPLPAVGTGRGLAIVRSVSEGVSVEADEPTVTVRCTFQID